MSEEKKFAQTSFRLINHSVTLEKLSRLAESVVLETELTKFRQKWHCKQRLSLAITPANQPHVERFTRLTLRLVFMTRLDMLLSQPFAEQLRECKSQLREEYLRLHFGYPRKKHLAFGILTVVVGCLVVGILQGILPELDINERLQMDVLHILVNVTLGVFIGDAAAKALTNKFVEEIPVIKHTAASPDDHAKISRIVSRFSTDSSKVEQAESLLRETQRILKVKPIALPPIVPRKLQDQTNFREESSNLDREQIEHRLKNYKMYSSQLSASMSEIRGEEEQSLLPYVWPVKLSVHLQCTSLHYKRKPLPKKTEPKEEPLTPPKKETIKKDTLAYWKNKLDKLKELSAPKEEVDFKSSCEEEAPEDIEIHEQQPPTKKEILTTQRTNRPTQHSPPKQSSAIETPKTTEANIPDGKRTAQPANYKLATLAQFQSVSLNQEQPKHPQQPIQTPQVPHKKKYISNKTKHLRLAKMEFERSCISNRIDQCEEESDCRWLR